MVITNYPGTTISDSVSEGGEDLKPAGSAATSAPLNESLLLGIILALTALLYATTLKFGFVYDDHLLIMQNGLVHFWRFVPEYFTNHAWVNFDPQAAGNYYRPLDFLWFRINDALFGLRPVAWHATTIFLHVMVTWLIYVLSRRLSGRVLVAAFTALLFAVHPMRHESVSWVNGIAESLWSVLFLLAFLAYLKSREGIRWTILSCVLYAVALLSKETAIMLPLVIFAHGVIYGNGADESRRELLGRRLSGALKTAAIYLPVSTAYVAARIVVLHGFSHTYTTLPLKGFLFTLPSVVFFYAKQWFFPVQFAASYGQSVWFRPDLFHVVLPTTGLLAIAMFVWFCRRRLGEQHVTFAAVWVITLLLPTLDFAALPQGDWTHDRYFYLPSFGVCLLLALAMEKLANGPILFRLPRKWLVVTLAVAALLSYDTFKATRYWANDYLLFEHAYQVGSANPNIRAAYANQLMDAGDYSRAFPILQQLLTERPNIWQSHFDLGHAFYQLGQFSTAEQYLKRAQQIDPSVPFPYLYLGLTYLRTHRLQDAEANLRQAVTVRPYEPFLHFSLASVLVTEAKCDEARVEFRKTLNLLPDMPHIQDQIDNCGQPKRN